MRTFVLARLLPLGMAVLLLALPAWAQAPTARPLWEQLAPLSTTTTQAAYIRLLASQGQFVAGGCEGVGNLWPVYVGVYDAATGQPRWQRSGYPKTGTCTKTFFSSGATGQGVAFIGNVYIDQQPNQLSRLPFLQRFSAAGDTLPARRLPRAQVLTTATAALADTTGFTLAGAGYDVANGQVMGNPTWATLTRTDTLGQVQWTRAYLDPQNAGGVSPNDVVHTPGGGYLITGAANDPAYIGNWQLWFAETDSQGQLRRMGYRPLFGYGVSTLPRINYNNTLVLAGHQGYVYGGHADSVVSSGSLYAWGFVARFDTALHKVWAVRLPARRSAMVLPTHVHQLANGLLQVAGWDYYGAGTPYVYVYTLDPQTGAILQTQEYRIPGLTRLTVHDWLPQADSSIVVAGQALRAGLPAPRGAQAWIGRYKLTTPLAATSPCPAAGPLRVYPVPARPGQPLWAELPEGSGAGTLVLGDALGRVRQRLPVGPARARAGTVPLPLSGLPPGVYSLRFLPDRPDQAPATARFVLTE